MKRHVAQNKKQKNGAFFTKNASELLTGYEHLVEGKCVIDPFAGNRDLIKWALTNGVASYEAYDIEPKFADTTKNDSLLNPPDYRDRFLLTNPPYLSRNKAKGDKTIFDMWGMDDLYKCHLASLFPSAEAGIIILPSNFLSESRSAARKMFFQNYTIGKAKYYTYSVFPEATTGIVVFDFKKDTNPIKRFEVEIHRSETDVEAISVELSPQYNYLYGSEFFDYIYDPFPLKIVKYDAKSKSKPNTNIVIGLLTNGTYYLGAHINNGEPLCVPSTTFTTYQVSIMGLELSDDQQKRVVDLYNKTLQKYIKKYRGMFLANYMGANQKIKSRAYSNLLLSRVTKEVMGMNPSNLAVFLT